MDLATLWYLTIGTLLLASAMTFWERKAHRLRARELGLWAAAYGVFALGGILAVGRGTFPGVAGPAITNIVMVLGYLLVLQGALSLDGRKMPRTAIAGTLVAIGAVWFIAGTDASELLWNHASALPIALICAAIAYVLLRSRTVRGLRSRPIAVAVFAGHALFYCVRAVMMPVVIALYGEDARGAFAAVTMYEAVLFAVAMSMSLLALVREEDRARLLTATRTDFLTGLNNRQGFFELAPRCLKRQGKDASHALLAIDLDHFKAINDRYGHEAGDRVLILFASIAADLAGTEATSARLGGEEFAILLPNTTGDDARILGEAIARRFAETAADRDGLGIPATVSIGLAETPARTADLVALLAAADRALYRAKTLGRNRIEVSRHGKTAKAA